MDFTSPREIFSKIYLLAVQKEVNRGEKHSKLTTPELGGSTINSTTWNMHMCIEGWECMTSFSTQPITEEIM
jgi:hypothetical protein